MNLKEILRRDGGAQQSRVVVRADAPPLREREIMEEELAEVQAVRRCIARVAEAREAHALVVGQKATLVRELGKTEGERRHAQEQLAVREKLIAVAGGELPNDAPPEEAEIAVLSRHCRIRQERVRVGEDKVQASQSVLDARIGETEEAWAALGTGD